MDDPDGYFGEPVAASYDDPSDPIFQPAAIESTVSLLAELAGSGQALELAIGTGRVPFVTGPMARRSWGRCASSLIGASTPGIGKLARRPALRHILRCARCPFAQSRRVGTRQSTSSLWTFQ